MSLRPAIDRKGMQKEDRDNLCHTQSLNGCQWLLTRRPWVTCPNPFLKPSLPAAHMQIQVTAMQHAAAHPLLVSESRTPAQTNRESGEASFSSCARTQAVGVDRLQELVCAQGHAPFSYSTTARSHRSLLFFLKPSSARAGVVHHVQHCTSGRADTSSSCALLGAEDAGTRQYAS